MTAFRSIRALVYWVAIVEAIAAPRLSAQGARGSAACQGQWSPPFYLETSDGRPVFVSAEVITPFGERTLAIGGWSFWMTKDAAIPTQASSADTATFMASFAIGGAFIDSSIVGTTLPLLDGGRHISAPQLLSSSGATKTVIWEWKSDERVFHADAIVAATFDGHRWLDTATLVAEPGTRSGLSVVKQPARSSNNDFEGVAGVAEGDSNRVTLAWRASGGWKTTHWKAPGHVTAAAATVTKDGRVLVVLMGGLPGNTGAGVYAIRMDRADTLAPARPVVIDLFGRGVNGVFSLARLGGDSLLIVVPVSDYTPVSSRIVSALTVDGGRRWQLLPAVPTDGLVNPPSLSLDGSGVLHMLYRSGDEDFLNAPGAIQHSTWHAGYWSDPVTLSQRPGNNFPTLGPAPGGKLLAVWQEMAGGVERGKMTVKSLASVWTPNCR